MAIVKMKKLRLLMNVLNNHIKQLYLSRHQIDILVIASHIAMLKWNKLL